MKRLLTFTLAALAFFSLQAQDIHFSQFNASPLTLNPALTGKLECTYRAAINYRNQWNAIPAPYVTYSAAFDAAIGREKFNGSSIGLGVLGFNDRSGDGNLTNTTLGLSLAYHQRIGESSFLSAGFQGAFVNSSVDMANLVFPNMIGPNGVIAGSVSGEAYEPVQYADLNVGMHWSSVFDGFSFNLGGAYYHALEPNVSLLGNDDITLPARLVIHGGFTAEIGDYYSLSPSILFMNQAGAEQLNTGASLGYHMDEAALYFGVWHRYAGDIGAIGGADNQFGNSDAIIALVGIEFSSLLLGFSYDITISEAAQANNSRGGFELSLSYNGCIEAKRRVNQCPKF